MPETQFKRDPQNNNTTPAKSAAERTQMRIKHVQDCNCCSFKKPGLPHSRRRSRCQEGYLLDNFCTIGCAPSAGLHRRQSPPSPAIPIGSDPSNCAILATFLMFSTLGSQSMWSLRHDNFSCSGARSHACRFRITASIAAWFPA